MSAEENRKLVIDFCRLLSERKLDEMFALMAEVSNWSAVGKRETFAYGGPKDKPGSIAMITAFLQHFREFRFEVKSSTGEDDRVAIEASSRGVGPSGKVYENQYLLMFRCAGGKIVDIQEYFDQITVLEYEKAESNAH